jgi:hypothetical protein
MNVRIVRVVLLAGLLTAASLGASAGGVAAYGHEDHPLAQIELSGNCNNPDFPLCFPPDQGGFGLGGVWLWIEIDDEDVVGDGMGTADVAGSVCGHVRGEGGGASSIRGEFPWWFSVAPAGAPIFLDPNGYYNVDLGPLGGVLPLPVTLGHYSFHPVPGVAIELQVAPSGPSA